MRDERGKRTHRDGSLGRIKVGDRLQQVRQQRRKGRSNEALLDRVEETGRALQEPNAVRARARDALEKERR